MTDRFDLTHGRITDKLVFIALPIIGTQLMQMAYNLTDMFWLGRVGSDAVAASGAAGMYLWLSAAFMMFGRMGAEIGVSQNVGRGDKAEAASYATAAIRISVWLGLIFAVFLMLLKGPLIGFFQIREAHVDHMAQRYLFVVAPYVPVSFVASAITGCFNASGNSKMPFYINGVGLILNVLLDPLLIFGFGLGVEGAAAATVIAQSVACAIFIYAVKRSKQRPFEHLKIFSQHEPVQTQRGELSPRMARARQIFLWSLPVALESLFFTFLTMLFSRLIAAWGSSAIAVLRVGSQLESLTWMIGEGFASAVTAFVGQNYGANKWGRIHRGFFISMALMCAWGLIVSAILFFCGRPMIGAFLQEPEALRMGTDYLRIMALSQVFMCLEFVAAGAFRGMGRTLPPSLASIAVNSLRVILAYWLAGTALGLNGVWWAMSLGAVGRGIWLFPWYLLHSRKLPRQDACELS